MTNKWYCVRSANISVHCEKIQYLIHPKKIQNKKMKKKCSDNPKLSIGVYQTIPMSVVIVSNGTVWERTTYELKQYIDAQGIRFILLSLHARVA